MYRRRKNPWKIAGVWAVVIVATAVLAHALFFGREGPETIRLYGRVIDETGRPVAGAQVVASAYDVKPDLVNGEPQRLLETEQLLEARTNEKGEFSLSARGRYELYVREISAPGYDWVVDLAWNARRPGVEHKENRYFRFANPYGRSRVYVSDEKRPAIFSLHRRGSATPATRPSRGGYEQTADGKLIPNEASRLSIPSAGPGAPRSPEEIERRMRELGPND